MNETTNRYIPEPTKRWLRQEAGFGCCKCGLPIIQYHHIVPFSDEAHNRPEDMMVLCPNHHHEATVGAMKEAEQRQLKSDPFNIKRGYAAGTLTTDQDFCAVNVGNNTLIGDDGLVRVDDESLLKLGVDAEGRIGVSISLYDESDNVLALIEHNEWISGDANIWDIKSSFQYLKIQQRHRNINLELDLQSQPMELRADLWRKKQNIKLSPQAITIDGVVRNTALINLCLVGMEIVIDTKNGLLELSPYKKYGESRIISWPDPLVRLQKGIEAWRELKDGS